jgi:uncharacterized RDD family membrane protein YckC
MIEKNRNDFGGFWIRLGAYFVDVVMMLLPTLLIRFLFHAVTPVATQLDQLVVAFGDIVISVLTRWVYTAAFLSSSWQATVGKRVCGLKVVDCNERRITFGRASGRYFGSFLSILLVGIGFMMIGWTRHRQGLHDLMAQTLVVKVDTRAI